MGTIRIVKGNKLFEEFSPKRHFCVPIILKEDAGRIFDKVYRLGPAVRILRNIIKRYDDKFEAVRNVFVYYKKVSYEYENEYYYKEFQEEKEYRLTQEMTPEQANEQIRMSFISMKIYFKDDNITIADLQNMYYFLDAISHRLCSYEFRPHTNGQSLFAHWSSYKNNERLGTNLLRDMYQVLKKEEASEIEFQKMLDEERLTERMSDHAYRVFDALNWNFEKRGIQFRERFEKEYRKAYVEFRVRPNTTVKESDIRLARRIYEKYVYPTIRTEFKVIVDGNVEKDSDK
jgi:hypothetical protein